MASDCFWNNVETLSSWTGRGDLAAVDRTDEPEDQLFFVFDWLSADSITRPKYPPPPEFGELTFCSFIGFATPGGGAGEGSTEVVGGAVAGCNIGPGAGRDMCGGRF